MGTDVYRVTLEGEGARAVRVYAHNAPDGAGVTVLAIDLGATSR